MRYLPFLFLCLPAAADEAAQSVINAQIHALMRSDYAEAFDYASPTIQSKFQTPEIFGMMVRDGYPMVHFPKDYSFTNSTPQSWGVTETLSIIGPDGGEYIAEYDLIETSDGWKINAVRIRSAPPPIS